MERKNTIKPDYSRIYNDFVKRKYPEKIKNNKRILDKKTFSTLDVISLNESLFGNIDNKENSRYRSYNKTTILEILDYQKKHKLNNIQLAKHFRLSRNTVSKWKSFFLV